MRIFTVLIILILAAGLYSCDKEETKKPPVAVILIAPETGPFTTTFTFNGEGSYDENELNENLQVRWDFDGDGLFDTEFSTTKIAEYKYSAAASYTVGLEAMNSDGWTDYKEATLLVYADSVAPIPSFVVEDDSSSVATIFLFNSAGSSDQYTPHDQLLYSWDWENDGIWDVEDWNDTIIHHKYEDPGVYRVALKVKNNISLTDTTSRIVHVYPL